MIDFLSQKWAWLSSDLVISALLYSIPVFLMAGAWLFFWPTRKTGRRVSGFIKSNYVELVWSLGVLLFAYACIFYLWDIIRSVAGMVDLLRAEAGKEPPTTEDIRNLAYAVAVLLGVLVAASTIPFGLIKVWMSERSTNAAEQGLITDRISQAIAGLGADKTVKVTGSDGTSTEGTEPNLEVRIGSIYALERIAQDSDRDHIQVMQILCTYIRTNAPWEYAKQAEQAADEFPRNDIQTALSVIGRRSKDKINLERAKNYQLDLRLANLKRADMRDGDFAHALFNVSLLERASIQRADMTAAILTFANLQNARLSNATFDKASARKADFSGSDITQTQINAMFGDGSVTSPEHLNWPKHWPEHILDTDEFLDEEFKWRNNPAGYTPPKPPEQPAKKLAKKPAKKTDKST